MLRHPWLAELVITGTTIRPRAAGLLEYVLAALKDHPASVAAKLTAFAVMTAPTAAYVQNEIGTSASAPQRQAAYLQHVAVGGPHPDLAEVLSELRHQTSDPIDQFTMVVGASGWCSTTPLATLSNSGS
jgi:hypothetical protein